jgi:hypothetical protein
MMKDKLQVSQIHYDDFSEITQIMSATATEWANGDGMDVFIQRKNLPSVQVTLTYDDIILLNEMFSDLNFIEG